MANNATWIQQAGVTPAKIALIGVLAVALPGVLYVQFGGLESSSSAVQSDSLAPSSPESMTANSNSSRDSMTELVPAGTAPKKALTLAHWQPPEIAAAVKYDPFARPASFPEPRSAELAGALAQDKAKTRQDESTRRAASDAQRQQTQAELEGLRKQGVHAIVKRDDKYVAIVGDQEVHVGDKIDGFTVIAIDADGVRVAKDLSP